MISASTAATRPAPQPEETERPQQPQLPPLHYETDERGVPMMPAELRQFDVRLNGRTRRGARDAAEIAAGVYARWKQNGFRPLQVSPPAQGATKPKCYEADSWWNADFEDYDSFVADFMWDRRWYDIPGVDADPEVLKRYSADVAAADLAYEQLDAEITIRTTYAKRECRTCPVRQGCLDSSLTRRRPRSLDPTFEPSGVWGGWGPEAREAIFAQLMRQWREETDLDLYNCRSCGFEEGCVMDGALRQDDEGHLTCARCGSDDLAAVMKDGSLEPLDGSEEEPGRVSEDSGELDLDSAQLV